MTARLLYHIPRAGVIIEWRPTVRAVDARAVDSGEVVRRVYTDSPRRARRIARRWAQRIRATGAVS